MSSDQRDPDGALWRWGVSSLCGEDDNHPSGCLLWEAVPELGLLHYLLGLSASPEMQQWEEAGSELRLWHSPLRTVSCP